MNISELVGDKLPEIKNLLFGAEETEATEETVEAAFLDAKLVDGTIVRIEPAVEVGAVVKVTADPMSIIFALPVRFTIIFELLISPCRIFTR